MHERPRARRVAPRPVRGGRKAPRRGRSLLFDEVLGPKHPFSWQVRGNRAEQIALQGRLEEAERIQREVAAKLEEIERPGQRRSRRGARAPGRDPAQARAAPPRPLPLHRRGARGLHRSSSESRTRTVADDALPARRGPHRGRRRGEPRRGAAPARRGRCAVLEKRVAAAPAPGGGADGERCAALIRTALRTPRLRSGSRQTQRLDEKRRHLSPRVGVGGTVDRCRSPQPAVTPSALSCSIQLAKSEGQATSAKSPLQGGAT